jgi:hypothetical protein
MKFWFRLPIRTRLGIIATVLLIFAIVLLLSWFNDPSHFKYRLSWVMKFAPLLFLLWLAWTDIKKIPWWGWFVIPVILLICAVKPPVWFIGIPLIYYILFFRT